MRTEVVRLGDPDAVAQRVADELVATLSGIQASGREPSLVLTGGSVIRKVHAAVAGSSGGDRVDWGRVDFWWGDERFVPSDDPERNAGQAWEDMLQRLPVDPTKVRAMAASDDGFEDVDAAAWDYAQRLREFATGRLAGVTDEPWFDVLMLGIGPDGHCASLFPDLPEVSSTADVLGVRDAPKPPPDRISLGMETLRRAREVWFVATGEEKADAVARSVAGEDPAHTPAAGPRGREATLWYVDEAAAAALD